MRKIKTISIFILLMVFTLGFIEIPYAASAADVLPAPIPVRAFSTSISSTNVNWGAVTGASGYAVYRATSSTGTYSLVLSTTTARSCNITGLVTGRTYYYKVRAYKIVGSSRVYGNFSTVASATPSLSAPTPVRAFPSSVSSINVNWGAAAGASGYAVYGATSSTGAYSLVLSTTARSCNITGLVTGRTYYYKVKAYRTVGSSRVYSDFSTMVSAKPSIPVPNSIRAFSSSSSSINVSWGAVTGVSGYEVYRAESDSETYSLLASTTAASYNNTGLVTGQAYYYKVRAYKVIGSSRVYSDFSAEVSAKPAISVPTPVRAFPTSINSVNVNWGAVDGADGYAVYRATSSTGTYSLVLSTTARSCNTQDW
jgi:fibronectin type 3 domain-containing protein